jgi:hypothetical protein
VDEEANGKKNRRRKEKKRIVLMLLPPVGKKIRHSYLQRKTRGFLAAGGGEDGSAQRWLQSRNRAAPEEEDKGNFPRTCL